MANVERVGVAGCVLAESPTSLQIVKFAFLVDFSTRVRVVIGEALVDAAVVEDGPGGRLRCRLRQRLEVLA